MQVFVTPIERPDYDRLIGLLNRVEPLRGRTGTEERDTDVRRLAAGCTSRWLVARGADDGLLGVAWVGHEVFSFEPAHPRFWIAVAPEARRQGVGSALWRAVQAVGRELGALTLKASTTVPDLETGHFAAHHGLVRLPGFVAYKRPLAAIDLVALDRELRAAESVLARRGLAVDTIASASADPGFWRRYAAFNRRIAPDLPGPVPCIIPPDDTLRDEFLSNPRVVLEGSFIAKDQQSGEIVGVSSLFRGPIPGEVAVGLTAVDAIWRRAGLARFLKNRAMLDAIRGGATVLTTMCFEGNALMRGMNERLGFELAHFQAIWAFTPKAT